MDIYCTGGLYCDIKLDWKFYQQIIVDLYMSKYAPNALN